MWHIVVGVFFVLHGLVHLLYMGQGARLFQLQPGMAWPDGSWAFSRPLGDRATRVCASVLCMLAAIGFLAGGIGTFVGQAWWHQAIVGAAALSAATFILAWDGKMQALANKGLIGILIDVAILVAVLVFQWPSLGF